MATIAIVYGGPSAAVYIAETDQDAERGAPVDVDETVARRLLAQDTWTEAKPPAKTPKGNA